MAAWEADFQISIDAWQAGTLSVGQSACERLLRRNDLPEEILLHTRRNATFYLRSLAELAPSYADGLLEFPVPDGRSRFTEPSPYTIHEPSEGRPARMEPVFISHTDPT